MTLRNFLTDPRLRYVLVALGVVAFLYLFIMERDRLISVAGAEASSDTVALEDEGQASSDQATQEDGATSTQRPVPVLVDRLTAQPLTNAVLLRGVTEAKRRITVQAETNGKVVSEPLPKGSFVQKGQALCEIDPGTRFETLADMRARLRTAEVQIPVAKARIEEAKARLVEAEINENAARKLSSDGFASETRLASAQAAKGAALAGVAAAEAGLETAIASVDSARAAIAQSERDIENLTVRAPFSGLLEEDTAQTGQFLAAGNPQTAACADLVDISVLRLIGYVSEMDVRFVKEGATGGARLTASDNGVQGVVTFVAKTADPLTRTFEVELEIANADYAIRAGETAEIVISANDVQAHLVPQSALTLNDAGSLGVRIAEGDRAKFVPVSVLRDAPDGVWVSGLPDEIDLIVLGHEYVRDGSLILVTQKQG